MKLSKIPHCKVRAMTDCEITRQIFRDGRRMQKQDVACAPGLRYTPHS